MSLNNFRDEEEFSPQEVQAAQNDLTNVLLLEHLYNESHGKVYPIALEVIRRGTRFVDDSSIGVALADKKLFEESINSCKIFICAYDNGKFTSAMKAFEITSESRRVEFGEMWNIFEEALDITKDGILRYRLWKSERDVLMKISKHGSNDTLKKLYGNSIDFEIMLHNCSFVLDAATELNFDLSKDEVLDNYVNQLKQILYDIRGKKEVEKLLGVLHRYDVRKAFNALYDEHDPQKAMRLYEQAARVGSGEAMYELGQLYMHFWRPCIISDMRGGSGGHPVAKDSAKALDWYRKAAAENYSPAMETLGSCYESGEGAIKDIYEAIHWYKKAALLGCSKAMGKLARIYQEGVRVPKDTTEARRWRDMETFDGYREGIRKLKAEFDPNAPVKRSVPNVSWMNSDTSAVSSASTNNSVTETEKNFSVATDNSNKESSTDNNSSELSKEDYPGLAFWLVLLGLYGFTSADFISSLIGAFIALAVVRIMV